MKSGKYIWVSRLYGWDRKCWANEVPIEHILGVVKCDCWFWSGNNRTGNARGALLKSWPFNGRKTDIKRSPAAWSCVVEAGKFKGWYWLKSITSFSQKKCEVLHWYFDGDECGCAKKSRMAQNVLVRLSAIGTILLHVIHAVTGLLKTVCRIRPCISAYW